MHSSKERRACDNVTVNDGHGGLTARLVSEEHHIEGSMRRIDRALAEHESRSVEGKRCL
jgi:hypothetical protein